MKVLLAAASVLAAFGLANASKAEPTPSAEEASLPTPDPDSTSTSTSTSTPASSAGAVYPDVWHWYDLHSHNRAVAFGSVILAASGSDVGTWKEARPYGFCLELKSGSVIVKVPETTRRDVPTASDSTATDDETGPTPIPSEPTPRPIPAEPASGTSCGWSLMVTTAYQFVECPNGRAYITRSGDGVGLTSVREGSVFSWAESVICDDGPFFTADQARARDVNRPLDLEHLTITMKN